PGAARPAKRGPAPRPPPGPQPAPPAFKPFEETADPKKAEEKAEEKAAAAAAASSRRGDLPESGWAKKWSERTKAAALLAALEAAQMHVVYALRPRSAQFQESVGSARPHQSELDRLLKEHATGRLKVRKQSGREAVLWLLEEGASLEALCGDTDVAVRRAAAGLFGELGEGAARHAESLLRSGDWQVRATAAEALGSLPGAEVAAQALAGLLEDSEALVRTAAVATLGKLGGSTAAAAAVAGLCAKTLGSSKPRAREAAAEVLGKLGPAAAEHAALLAQLLQDADWRVPTVAGNALKRMGGAGARSCAEVLARCEPSARGAAADALVWIGGADCATAVAGLLGSEDEGVRRHAAEVLGQLGAEAAGPHCEALSALSSDQRKEVRQTARRALNRLGHRQEAPALEGDGDALPDAVAAALQQWDQGQGRGKGRGSGGKGARPDQGGTQRAAAAASDPAAAAAGGPAAAAASGPAAAAACELAAAAAAASGPGAAATADGSGAKAARAEASRGPADTDAAIGARRRQLGRRV
ncbi:unnamed protein product, partial [Prorocentrum cordatum]